MATSTLLSEILGEVRSRPVSEWSGLSRKSPAEDSLIDSIRAFEQEAEAAVWRGVSVPAVRKRQVLEQIGFKFTPKHLEILLSETRFRILRAGRRSGKTTAGGAEAAAEMIVKPGAFGVIAAQTYKLVRPCFAVMVRLLRRAERAGLCKIVTCSMMDRNLRVVLENGAECVGYSLDWGEFAQGFGCDFLVLDECALVEEWVWTRILRPTLGDRRGWAMLIGTPQRTSWYTRLARSNILKARLAGLPPQWKEWTFPTWENSHSFPGGPKDPEILQLKAELPWDVFAEQIMGIPMQARDVIYKDFREDVHIQPWVTFKPGFPVYLGIDPSASVNPYAVVVVQRLDMKLHIVDEFYETGRLTEDVVTDLARRPWWGSVKGGVMDSANPSEILRFNSVAKRYGATFSVIGVDKPRHDESLPIVRNFLRDPMLYNRLVEAERDEMFRARFPGQSWDEVPALLLGEIEMQLLLDMPADKLIQCSRLFISPHCTNLAIEFQEYKSRQTAERGDGTSLPETAAKAYDHCFVAGTMIETIAGSVPIEQMRPGMLVVTRQGYKEVVAAWLTNPNARVIEVEFSDGRRLVGTGNHPVWVDGRGWVRMDRLRYSDRISVWNEKSNLSSLTASPTGAIQRRSRRPIATTSGVARQMSREASAGCIGMYGFSTTAQSRLAMTSTTSIVTNLITAQKISRFFWRGNMRVCTVESRRQDVVGWAGITRLRSNGRRNGIGRQKDLLGIPRTARSVGLESNRPIISAMSVARHSNRVTDPWCDSAQTTANQHSDGNQALIMRNDHASGVASRSPVIATAGHRIVPVVVVRITERGSAPVYNLTVADTPEYYANGILVHNCLDSIRYLCWHYWRHEFLGSGTKQGSSYMVRGSVNRNENGLEQRMREQYEGELAAMMEDSLDELPKQGRRRTYMTNLRRA